MPVLQLLFGFLSPLYLCCLGCRVLSGCNSREQHSQRVPKRGKQRKITHVLLDPSVMQLDMLHHSFQKAKYKITKRQNGSDSLQRRKCVLQCDRAIIIIYTVGNKTESSMTVYCSSESGLSKWCFLYPSRNLCLTAVGRYSECLSVLNVCLFHYFIKWKTRMQCECYVGCITVDCDSFFK